MDSRFVLPAGAVIALVWANTLPLGYAQFAHACQFVVNDIGMVLFFALAAKEVVEATAPGGALHTWRRAALPVASAAGGMIAPALIYVAIVRGSNETLLLRGWAIPCATDIAFSYLAARAIFGRHPAVSFLLLLAIVDDALGLIILAVWYPIGNLHLVAGGVLMAAALASSAGLRRLGAKSFWPYILVGGSLSWLALFLGGFHPALALVPIIPFLPRAPRDPGLFVEAPAGAHDALSALEHRARYPVQAVLFSFALVNAGVRFEEFGTGTVGPMLNETKIGALLSLSGSAVAMAAAKMLKAGRFSEPLRYP